MIRRFSLLLPLLVVLGAVGLSMPQATSAANPADPDGSPYTESLAGRPVNGYSYDWPSTPLFWDPGTNAYQHGYGTGMGIAYANVGGMVALLYPHHGRDDASFDGKMVYGPNGSAIGYFQTQSSLCYAGDCAADHDLSVIILYDGNWPANINQVYRGDVTGADWWTITENPSIAPSCTQDGSDNSDTLLGLIGSGRTVYENVQLSSASSVSFRTGQLDAYAPLLGGACAVRVTLTDTSNFYRDSGAPFVLCCNAQSYTSTVWAITSSRDVDGPGPPYKLVVTPLYEGIHVLYEKYQALGSTAGICKTATCGGIAP